MKYKTLISILLISILSLPSLAARRRTNRYIGLQKLEGANNVGLALSRSNQNVSLKYNNATPIITLQISNLRELFRQGGGKVIKIDVFKTRTEPHEFVGSFTYRLKSAKRNSATIQITLPQMTNQSEDFDFVVYDTAGTARARYRHSFFAAELITSRQAPDQIDPKRDNASLVSDEMLEEIVRSLDVQAVSSKRLVGVEKTGTRSYAIKVPSIGAGSSSGLRANVSSLKINASGTLAERAIYDNAAVGFVFFDKENLNAYVKGRGTAAWSEPIPLSGDVDMSKISNLSLDKLVNGTVLEKLVNDPIVAADLNPINQSIASLRTDKLNADLSNLPNESLTGDKIQDSSITADDLAPGVISFTGDRYITLLPGDNDMYYDNQYFSGRGCGTINSSSLYRFITKRISFAYCLPTYSLWTFQVPTDWELGTDMAVEIEWFATDNSVLGGANFTQNTSWEIYYKNLSPGQSLPSSFDASTPRNDAQANANLISAINGFTKRTYVQTTPRTFNQIVTTGTNLLISGNDISPGSTVLVAIKRGLDPSENNFFNSINAHKAKIIYKSKHVR